MVDQEIFLHTTRKKALEIMQKGIVSYCLTTNPKKWDVAEHFGDGYDLLAMRDGQVIKIELKAIDLNEISTASRSFTQSISANEVLNATHLVISIFNQSQLIGNYIMTIEQLFNFKKNSKSSNYSEIYSFKSYKVACRQYVKKKSLSKKGSKKNPKRMALDINCSINSFKNKKWKLEQYKDSWDNLEQ